MRTESVTTDAEGGTATGTDTAAGAPPHAATVVGLAVLPLAVLVGVLVLVATVGLPAFGGVPVEELHVERVTLEPGLVLVKVRNVGPEPVTVAQVFVDDAIHPFTVSPDATIPRLRTATIAIPHPWVDEEPVNVAILTEALFKFEHEVEAAYETPRPDARTLGALALIGLYVGAIPVLAGLLWRPLLERVREEWLTLFLGVTVGLLLFLGADALLEGWDVARELPAATGAPFLLAGGAVLAYAALEAVRRRFAPAGSAAAPAVIAVLVALGIGLHNLAEGLAIGAAFALGQAALGAFLVVGFALHNTTEGLAIVAPLSRRRARIPFLLGLGLLAGLPVVPGGWIGAFAPSPYLALAFLGVGAGAIAQVARAVDDSTAGALRRGIGLAGVAAGVVVMYATSLLIAL